MARLKAILLFVFAAVFGGFAGRFIASELVVATPPQQGQRGKVAMSRPDGQVEEGRGRPQARKSQVGREEEDLGLRQSRLIAEVKVVPGPYKHRPFRVAGIRKDGSVEARAIDSRTVRRGLRSVFTKSLRKWGKAPKNERYAQLRRFAGGEPGGGSSGESREEKEKGPRLYPGDVYLYGIPMIDQGQKAYCAVASAARVLQGYGIEITMEDMAELAGSSETGGTDIRRWDQALRKVAREHGLELKAVPELTEILTPLPQLVYDYNEVARDLGYSELHTWDYVFPGFQDYASFTRDREYPVQRERMVSDDRKCEAFNDNVIERIDDSDPLFWSVTTGEVPEEVPYYEEKLLSGKRGSHMRLIIGYNEKRGEILYSDSWGEGHEIKRMDGQDALSITRGMYYLAD